MAKIPETYKKQLDSNEKISLHFTLKQVVYSDKAILNGLDNSISGDFLINAKDAAINCFDLAVELVGSITCNSWFRSKALNDNIGGSATSDHCKATAIDIYCKNEADARSKYQKLKALKMFDQLILEKHEKDWWVHLGYRKNGRKMIFEIIK